MRLFITLLISATSFLRISAQALNDDCASARYAGSHDGNYTFLSWDFNLFDTCISVNNSLAQISYPYLRTDSACHPFGGDRVARDVWFRFTTTGAFTIRGTQPQGVSTGTDSVKLTFFRGDSCEQLSALGSYEYVISTASPVFYDTVWLNATNNPESVFVSASGIHSANIIDFYLCFRAINAPVNQLEGCSFSSANNDTVCFGYSLAHTNAPFGAGGGAAVTNLNGRAPFTFVWTGGSTDSAQTNMASGLHVVTITDSAGCSVTDSVSIQADCSVNLIAQKIGPSWYRFYAQGADTVVPKHLVWHFNTDTIMQDTSVIDILYQFNQDTIFQICLTATDSGSLCHYDTCIDIEITNSHYVPLLDSVNVWHYVGNQMPVITTPDINNSRATNCGYFGFSPWEGFTEWTGNDTTINGNVYRELWSSVTNVFPSQNCLMGYLHEDIFSRKIYFRDIDSSQDFLLYDFGLEVGDSIYLNFGAGIQTYTSGMYKVEAVSMFTAPTSTPRREYFLKRTGGSAWQYPLRWVEGIGNMGYLIYRYINWWQGGLYWGCPEYTKPEPPQVLSCFEHSQLDYFSACALNQVIGNNCFHFIDTCSFYTVCGGINDPGSLKSFDLAPNPAHDNLTIHLDVSAVDEFEFRILDLNLRDVSPSYTTGMLHEGEYIKTIKLLGLVPGLYFVQCSSANGRLIQKLVID